MLIHLKRMLIIGIILAKTGGPLHAMDRGMSQRRLDVELIGAAMRGKQDSVQGLLQQGAQIDPVNDLGRTALMVAAYNGNRDIVQFLIKNGADVNRVNKEGRTALMWAARGTRPKHLLETCKILIKNGADVYRVNELGETALIVAAKEWGTSHHGLDTCKLLVHAMLKLTKEQKDSVYALIASLERTPSLQTSKDTRGLIAQRLINAYKKENRDKTRAEIEKIENVGLRNQLLQLLEGK